MSDFSVTQYGKPLNESLYTFDGKEFKTSENNLVLDFYYKYVTFKTGFGCTFNTPSHCTFKTENNCVFYTGSNCTFETDYNCTFKTCSKCSFKTGTNCTFSTGSNCTFETGSFCIFSTDLGCVFKTGINCSILGFANGLRMMFLVDDVIPKWCRLMGLSLAEFRLLYKFPLQEPELLVLYKKDIMGLKLFKGYIESSNVK